MSCSTPAGDGFAVVRVLPSWPALDTSFENGGKAVYEIEGQVGSTYDMKLQADDKIVLAGALLYDPTHGYRDSVLLRLDPDGALDGSFGAGGIAQLDIRAGSINQPNDSAGSLCLTPDGGIVGLGLSSGGTTGSPFLIRVKGN